MEIEELRNEVFRKIGRNIVLFQQVEQLLKFLIIYGKIEGYAGELETTLQQRSEKISKKTMGQLIGQHIEDNYLIDKEFNGADTNPVEREEIYFSFDFTMSVDAAYYEKKKKTLASLVAERNNLIHHFSPHLDSIQSLSEAERYLDDQHERILPERDELLNIVQGFEEYRAFMRSDEGKQQMLLWLILIVLGQIAAKADGHSDWTLLSAAGQRLWKNMPDGVSVLKKCGYKNLKSFMLATGFFEINEKSVGEGGVQVLYRLKPE